jgi:hypothetical protein
VAAVAGAVLISPHNKLEGRNRAKLPMKALGDAPILQLELARNEGDIRAVLMEGDIARNLADARAGNQFDTWLFIPGYAGVLLTVGALLARVTPRRAIVVAALAAIPVIAVCDWVENAGIEHAIDHVARGGAPLPGDAQRISTPSIFKWTLLALVLVCYGVTGVFSRAGWVAAGVGIICLAASAKLGIQLAGYFRERFFN